jgi:hypothetical protein
MFDAGYPLPASTPMPAQAPLPQGASVHRPSGPCAVSVPEGQAPLLLAGGGVALAAAAWWSRRLDANRTGSAVGTE